MSKKIFKRFSSKKLILDNSTIKNIFKFFELPNLKPGSEKIPEINNSLFLEWKNQNVLPHKHPNYSIILVSLKSNEKPPGDASSNTNEKVSRYSRQIALAKLE